MLLQQLHACAAHLSYLVLDAPDEGWMQNYLEWFDSSLKLMQGVEAWADRPDLPHVASLDLESVLRWLGPLQPPMAGLRGRCLRWAHPVPRPFFVC
eukprot:8432707-Alexandrium_andersonii.AAC.1